MGAIVSVVTVKADEVIYLMCDPEGSISNFPSKDAGIAYFERKFEINHGRGFEASMSACIHYMQFEYRCHDPVDVQTLMPNVVEPEARIKQVSSGSGRFIGAVCTGPEAAAYHESGALPRLVRD